MTTYEDVAEVYNRDSEVKLKGRVGSLVASLIVPALKYWAVQGYRVCLLNLWPYTTAEREEIITTLRSCNFSVAYAVSDSSIVAVSGWDALR